MEEKIQVVDSNHFEKVLKETNRKMDNLSNKMDEIMSFIHSLPKDIQLSSPAVLSAFFSQRG